VTAVLRDEGLVKRSVRVGSTLLGDLEALGERHEQIVEVRGRGLMIGVEFVGDGRSGDVRPGDSHPGSRRPGDDRASVAALYHALLERGFLAGCKPAANLLRFYPPLVLPQESALRLTQDLAQVLQAAVPDVSLKDHSTTGSPRP
jgi:4-aminobutyrate aminotransferase-like enzyme